MGGSAAHNFRERPTPNANPQITPDNITSGAQSAKEVIAAVKVRLNTVPTVRKNGVLAIEYFIGASPEWFKEQPDSAREAYFDRAERWLKGRHGSENVIAFTRQYDETSPHVCAYVVPIDPKGRLNCSYFLDGRTKLSEMQTEFAERVGKPFGLQRGIEGSTARHQTIKTYYSLIQARTPEPQTVIPAVSEATFTEKMAEAVGMVTDHSRAVDEQFEARQKRLQEVKLQHEVEHAKAKQYDIEKPANRARSRQNAELRLTSTQARNLPLESVLERFGCTPEVNDAKNWRTPVGRITVTDAKFYAHDLGKGGGGAIDLVMTLEEIDYKQAVGYLIAGFGSDAVVAQVVVNTKAEIDSIAKQPLKPFQLPKPSPENWPRVRKYLTEVRRLSEFVVDWLYKAGKIYADRHSNVAFTLGSEDLIGVELRGTGEKPFHGVRGEKMPFIIPNGTEKRIAFVESAIDAMSLYDLNFKGKIASTSGNPGNFFQTMAKYYQNEGFTIIAAFDNDRAGDQMAANLGHSNQRMRPKLKDWNDDLRAARAAGVNPPVPAPAADLKPKPPEVKQDKPKPSPPRPRR